MKPILSSVSETIDLTDSVMMQQERMESELMSWLDRFVVWQFEAKKAIIATVMDWLSNVYRDQGALGAVFLAWPTWIGKTELARALAYIFFWDVSAFTKISAETMPHPADISQLVWSPSGYIWYGDTPEMADINIHSGYKIAKEKWKLHSFIQGYEAENFSIVLIDEIEKAHPDIPNAFLWAIQSWEMKMTSWKEVDSKLNHHKFTDLRNTLFIFTSNIWEHAISRSKKGNMWFTTSDKPNSGDAEIFSRELKNFFAPEFIWRMDKVVRCSSLSKEELWKVFRLHEARMNTMLEERQYFTMIRVHATETYVDTILGQSKWIDYWARAIVPAVKRMWSLTWMAIHSGKIPKDTNGVLEFDIENGAPILRFSHVPLLVSKELTWEAVMHTSILENTRLLVEWRINKYGDQVRDTVQAYLSLIASYNSGFADTCRIYENRLRWYGFNTVDIKELRSIAYISVYQSVEQSTNYEILTRHENVFLPVSFQAIEKFLRAAVAQSLPLKDIYRHIWILIKRPMTENESILLSQYIHRLLNWKPSGQK